MSDATILVTVKVEAHVGGELPLTLLEGEARGVQGWDAVVERVRSFTEMDAESIGQMRERVLALGREYGVETIRVYDAQDALISHVCDMVDYWLTLEKDDNRTIRDRLEGLAFSLLVMMDGDALAVPNLSVATEHGEVLSGGLHEAYMAEARRRRYGTEDRV